LGEADFTPANLSILRAGFEKL
ncbi:MAG: hypothetical protein RLY89_1007, partial [Bacteroidota bacterium]